MGGKLKIFNLELEKRKTFQGFHCESSINIFWFCFISTKVWFLLFERNQLFFCSLTLSIISSPADTQLFKFFFHLVAFGYIPGLHCPKQVTCEPGGFLGVHQDAFSGNSCLATLQVFCSLPMNLSHQASGRVSCSFDCPSVSFALPAARSSMPGTNSWTFCLGLVFVLC